MARSPVRARDRGAQLVRARRPARRLRRRRSRLDAGQRPQRERVVGAGQVRAVACARAPRVGQRGLDRVEIGAQRGATAVQCHVGAALGAQRAIDRGAQLGEAAPVRAVTATTSQPSSARERLAHRAPRRRPRRPSSARRRSARRARGTAAADTPSARAASHRRTRSPHRASVSPCRPTSASSAICSSALRALRLYVPGRSWRSAAPVGQRELAAAPLDGDAGIVRDLRRRAGQRVEQRRLADVRVAGERDLRPRHRRGVTGGRESWHASVIGGSTAICAASLRRIDHWPPRTSICSGSPSGATVTTLTSVPGHQAHLEQAAAERARSVDPRDPRPRAQRDLGEGRRHLRDPYHF